MSRTLKVGLAIVLGAPVACMVGGLAMYALQPNAYRVTRTRVIRAPRAVVHAHIADLRAYVRFESPPSSTGGATRTVTFGETTTGVGAFVDTANMEETARYTLVSVTPTRVELARTVLEGTPSTQIFTLREVSEGTEVTWSHGAHMAGLARLLYPFVDLERMVGDRLAEGLARLERNVVHAGP